MRRFFEASVVLLAVLFATAAVASSPASDAPASPQVRPVRSSVTPARVIYAPRADFTEQVVNGVPRKTSVILKVDVGENGKVQYVKVINSENPALDGLVMDAVSKYRFIPARVDNRPAPVEMNLVVKIEQ